VKLDEIGSQLLVSLVGEDVEMRIIPEDILDGRNTEELVEVVFLVILKVDHLSVSSRCYNADGLIWVEDKELWLLIKVLEVKELVLSSLNEVKLNDFT